MITTVVFDLDDTLYDEVDYCRSGFKAVAEFAANQPGYPAANSIFDAFWNQFTAGNHTKVFNSALQILGINYEQQHITEMIEVYRNHVPTISLPPDSRNVLNLLSKEYTLALLTDGFLPAQKLKVHALGIEKYFKSIIYTEELGRDCWKPSPVGFQKLIEELDIAPNNAVFIGDNEKKDFIAPNRLGFSTIQLTRPRRIHKETADEPQAKARFVIPQIDQIPRLLKSL